MDQESYGRFLAAQGARIVKAAGELWVEKRKFFLENIPPHRRIHLGRRDATKLFLHGHAVIRYSCDETEGRASYELILDKKDYDLNSLDHKARNQTRRGLENCVVERIDFDLLAREGCAINRSVFARQQRAGPPTLTDEKLWTEYMATCRSMNDIEAWGAFAQGTLCAYLLAVIIDDYAYSFHGFPLTEYLKIRPINALFFTVYGNLLRRPNVAKVSLGLEPFASHPALEDFKISMGFRRQSIGRQLVVNPLARPFLTRPFEWLAQGLVARGKFNWPLEDFLTFSKAFRERSLGGKHAEFGQ